MPDLHMLAVGKPYGPRLPQSEQYNYRGGSHELLLVWANLTNKQRDAVRRGTAAFAFYAQDDQIIFLYRFGGAIPWSDTPFTIHRLAPDEQVVPPPAQMREPHVLLTVILVRQETGIVEVLRQVTFSPAFTVALHGAIQRQAALPYERHAYEQGLAALYRRYPTTRDLLAAATSTTIGGR